MQSVSSKIWTCVAVSISYDDNNYTTGTSNALALNKPTKVDMPLNKETIHSAEELVFLVL